MSQPNQHRSRPRRWFQFSLRTLLIATAAAAGLAFGYLKIVEPYRLQREAMAAITKLGGTYKTEDAIGWVRYLDKNAQDVVVVDLADCDKPEEYLPHLLRLPRLRALVIGGQSVGDEQIAALGRMASLRWLVLDSTKVNDKAADELKRRMPDVSIYKSERRAVVALAKLGQIGYDVSWFQGLDNMLRSAWSCSGVDDAYFDVADIFILGSVDATDDDVGWLTNLSNVTKVYLESPRVTGSCLADITTPPSLRTLSLKGANITDAALQHIARFRHLTWLDLSDTAISDNGLAQLVVMKDMTFLNLRSTRISDDGLTLLRSFGRLEHLGVGKTRMSDRAIETLKRVLPRCDVWDY